MSDRLQDASLRQRDSSSFPPLLPAESLGDLRYLPSPPAMLDTRGLISSRDVALEGSYPPRLRSGVIVGTSEHSQWGPALPLSSMPMPMSMPSAIDYRSNCLHSFFQPSFYPAILSWQTISSLQHSRLDHVIFLRAELSLLYTGLLYLA